MAGTELDRLYRLIQVQGQALDETQHKIDQWDKFKRDYVDLKDRLESLPDKISYDIMVPFGSVALMPGQLVHTNEILVLLGDNWFVERSAKQACQIIERRLIEVDKQLTDLYKQKDLLANRHRYTYSLEEDEKEFVEIKEKYDPELEAKWKEARMARKLSDSSQTHRKGSDEYLKRLDELERQEARNEELRTTPHVEGKKVRFKESITMETEDESDDSYDSVTVSNEKTSSDDESHVITFKHTPRGEATPLTEPVRVDIKSPADIYDHFVQQTHQSKSILKPQKTNASSERPSKEILPGSIDAFSGTVLERHSETVDVERGKNTKVVPASKFKQRRVKKT